jgi:hypothetical protein
VLRDSAGHTTRLSQNDCALTVASVARLRVEFSVESV